MDNIDMSYRLVTDTVREVTKVGEESGVVAEGWDSAWTAKYRVADDTRIRPTTASCWRDLICEIRVHRHGPMDDALAWT